MRSYSLGRRFSRTRLDAVRPIGDEHQVPQRGFRLGTSQPAQRIDEADPFDGDFLTTRASSITSRIRL